MEHWMTILLFIVTSLYIYYLFRTFSYFKRHNVIYAPYVPIVGSMMPVISWKLSFSEFTLKLYNSMPDAKYFGFYLMTDPIIMLRDPQLIKEIFIKKYEIFPNRRGFSYVNECLIADNLFSLQGQKWKKTRALLTPVFTSSKLKTMFTLIMECAANTAEFLSNATVNQSSINIKDVFTKYTNDVIATYAFGHKVDSLRNPKNDFYINGQDGTNLGGIRGINFIVCTRLTTLSRIFGLKIVKTRVVNFFKNTVKDTIATREAQKITRPDMIQMMMDINSKHETEKELSIDDMTAQAYAFYFGGFETTATITAFAAHEIAINPGVQQKLYEEIKTVLEESDGIVTYDAFQNKLNYLEMVIYEVLRLYPPVAFVERTCEKDYELPPALPDEKPFVLKKGQILWAPVYAIQRDKKYFENPEQFFPERFLDKNIHNSACFISFGLGPRMCIAKRFAILKIKILLFYVLAQCELKSCAKTMLPMKFSKKTLLMMPETGFWLNVQRRSDYLLKKM